MKKISGIGPILLLLTTLSASYGQASETREMQAFTSIRTEGLVQVYMQQGDRESLRLAVEGIGLRDVISSVENGMLTIKTAGNYNGEDIKAYLTYRQLNSLSVGGASKLVGESTIKGKALQITTNGAGDAFLTVDVDSLQILMEGAGNLTIAGKTKVENITTKGRVTGSLDKTGLTTAN